jgi:hypothetical protein
MNESIVGGNVSARVKPNSWQVDASINLGNSGSPVFNDDPGSVVGIVTSGVTQVTLPSGQVVLVEGIKYFAPIDVYSIPRLGGTPHVAGVSRRTQITQMSSYTAALPRRAAPAAFSRGYHLSFEKTDHPVVLAPSSRDFETVFEAEPGYRIAGVTGITATSANHASAPQAQISEDGRRLTVRITLTSGPVFDQYRAWFEGTVFTTQQRIER